MAHNPDPPGRFQDENPATVYFYTMMVQGINGEEIGDYRMFKVNEGEAAFLKLTKPCYMLWAKGGVFSRSVYGFQATYSQVSKCRKEVGQPRKKYRAIINGVVVE